MVKQTIPVCHEYLYFSLTAALRSPPDRRVALDLRVTWFIYSGLRQAFLRRGMFSLHSGEGLLHVSEQLTRLRDNVGIAVTFSRQ